MKLHSLLFLATIVVACRAYYLPARRRPESLRLLDRRGLRDRRTDSLDVEAQFSAEADAGGADNYKDYNLQPSTAGFVSGEGGGLIQAEAHASAGNQYVEGNSINEYGVDTPGEMIYDNNYGQVPQSSEIIMDHTNQELELGQADNTAQSTSEVQFSDASQNSAEAQADKIVESNLEFSEGAKFTPESQVDSSGQNNGGAQQGDQANYSTVPQRPNSLNGANQYSGVTPINAPTASQTVEPWNSKFATMSNPYSANPHFAGIQYNPYQSYKPGSYNPGSYNGAYNGGSYNGGSYNGGSYNGGSYNGGSYNGGSYNGGSYNGGPYNGGPYNGGSYKGATGAINYAGKNNAYKGATGAINYAGKNNVPPNGPPPNGVPYNGGTGYGGINQGSATNQFVGNVYSSGPQAASVNQANGYSQYGSYGGYNSSKFGNSQYSTAESSAAAGAYSKPGSGPPNKGTQFNRDQYKKLPQNTLPAQVRAPYSLTNYNAGGFEAGTEKTSGQKTIVPSGVTSTNVIESALIPYQEPADSKVNSNSAPSSQTEVVGQVNESSKYSGEIPSSSAQVQEQSKALARANYGGESLSSSELKQGTDTQYPKLDKVSKYIRQAQDRQSSRSKRNRSKKVIYSPETPYGPNALQQHATEAPPKEIIPSVDTIETRFKPNYPHRDYGYEHARSPRWHHG